MWYLVAIWSVGITQSDLLYYHIIFIFAVLERLLIYEYETECSFVYLIF